jgi:glycine cleavage system H protein
VSDRANLTGQGEAERAWFSFAMGEFTAEFPRDRHYAGNHMWAQEVPTPQVPTPQVPTPQRTVPTLEVQRWRFGLTAYAVRLLQDVYFLDWILDPPTEIASRAHIGAIESKKAESDLYAPLAGKLVAINDATLSDPSLINADTYHDGWMIEIETDETEALLSPDAYAEHLVKAWEVAQRTIKGQAND